MKRRPAHNTAADYFHGASVTPMVKEINTQGTHSVHELALHLDAAAVVVSTRHYCIETPGSASTA